jgi:hypothetical protein
MNDIPTIRASLTLLPDLERGRNTLWRNYRPHIVIGPATQREAKMQGNAVVERYQSVVFMDDCLTIEPGETVEVTMALAYYQEPNILYDDVVPGATFTLREGANIVGYGTVLSRAQQGQAADVQHTLG